MSDCIFCKIRDNEIPSQKIYEDDDVFAILDINPVNYGHTLIIPKKHHVNMLDANDEVLKKMVIVSKKIAQAIMTGLDYSAFNLEVNNGKIAGQLVPHAHWHIVPRLENDGLENWPSKKYKEGKDAETANKIKNEL